MSLTDLFRPKQPEKTPEKVDETLSERVGRLEKRITRLEAEQLDLATAQDIIRDKVLRKIQVKKAPEPESEPAKDIYKGVLISEH